MPLLRVPLLFVLAAFWATSAGVLGASAFAQDRPGGAPRSDSSANASDVANRPSWSDSAAVALEGRLDEITVTASRIRIDRAAAPQRVTLFDAVAIERTGARHVGDLLAARAGVFIRQYGEGLATISLRGASPSQTLVLLDGMRLSDPQLGQVDLSLFPTFVLGAVEVLHGTGSAVYGSDGMGGVVNLRAREANRDAVRLSSEVGAYGARRLEGGASFRGARTGLLVAGEYASADGDFPYLNQALFPPREVRRRNADRLTRSLYASAFLNAGRHRLKGSILFADAARGVPGIAMTGGPEETQWGGRQWDHHFRLWISEDVRLQSGRLALRGYVHRSRLRYLNASVDVDDTGRVWSGAVEAERVHPIAPEWLLDAGISAGYARAEHPMLSESAAEVHAAAFTEAVGQLGPVTAYPAVRIDAYGIGSPHRRIALSPRLGANAPVVGGNVHLKASAGRAFRNPTFNERYWQPGSNPDLHPESAWSFELGVHVEAGDVAASGKEAGNGVIAPSRNSPAAAARDSATELPTVNAPVASSVNSKTVAPPAPSTAISRTDTSAAFSAAPAPRSAALKIGLRRAAAMAKRLQTSFSGELTLVHTRTMDQIVWTPERTVIWIPKNLSETQTSGVEASVQFGAAAGGLVIESGATYSFTHSVDRSDATSSTFGRQLRYVPRHLLKGFAGLSLGAIRLNANVRWIGRRFVTADESQWLDPELVVDFNAGFARRIGGIRAELSIMLENALDANYAVIQNYPMPPRHARARLVIQTARD